MNRKIKQAVFLIALALQTAPAAPEESACTDTAYENHNQIDYKPLKVSKIKGRGVIEIRNSTVKPNEPVPGACLSLFTPDKKFIVSVKASSEGNFEFAGITPGRYQMVARAKGFCTANIPIQVVKASRKIKLQSKEVVVHYRVSEIDTCSWGALGNK